MASSMLNGERKWAAPRRSGMTVLGKVAVPKPINLPSLRLENHGLDPNIEIVPKGSLSWGSKLSSGSNAWSSSVSSPKEDSTNVSPIHLSGRPSSSGDTRPSTAGSERHHDSTSHAWRSNARPSSASGSLTSSHTSLTSLRPHSAETRPSSSQLSRFAEPLAENLRSWDAAGSTEKSGVGTSANDGFSISPGDFPTLGSEKDRYVKNKESLDHGIHGCPESSSGEPSVTEGFGFSPHDEITRNADVKGSGIGTWRKDNTHDEGPHPVMERWHGDPYPYQSTNIPPHHESRHGAPGVNLPGGVWPRGPPVAPLYRAPIPPGSFHMERFPYFRPQVLPPVLPNPHKIPPQGPGPRGPHINNGQFHRPLMGDPYIHPAMPIRPGFYPGPVAHEGYYGPSMHFCNLNGQDFPFMGMAGGPPVYNRCPSNSFVKSAEGITQGQVEFGPISQGNHKASGQQDIGLNQDHLEGKWANKVMANVSSFEPRDFPQSASQESILGDEKGDLMINREKSSGEEASSQSIESSAGHTSMVTGDTPRVIGNLVTPRNRMLIQKIEGLNAKARASDGRHDPQSGFHREEPHSGVQVANIMAGRPVNETGAISLERHPTGILVPVSHDTSPSMETKGAETAVSGVTTISRRSAHGAQNRGSHVKDKIHNHDVERKNAATSGNAKLFSEAISVPIAEAKGEERPIPSIKPYIEGRDDAAILGFNPSDNQRAKMREIAKQRAIQLQKEEEERTREQKAKALAKLEELNRRSGYQIKDSSSQKVGNTKQEVSGKEPGPSLNSDLYEPSSSQNYADTDGIYSKVLQCAVPSFSFGTVTLDSVHENLILAAQNISINDNVDQGTAPQACEPSQPKRPGYKQKLNATLDNTSAGKSILDTSTDVPDESTTNLGASDQVVVNDVASASRLDVHVESQVIADSSTSLKKGNNRGARNKHKLEKSSSAIPPSSDKESGLEKDFPENVVLVSSESKLDPPPIPLSSNLGDATSTDKVIQDSRGRVDHSRKQHHRRTQRNAQINKTEESRGNDSVVWTPVRSQSKGEVIDDSSQKPTEVAAPMTKNDHLVQSNPKGKRAEMERYVPKPVAKELAQQASIQQSFPPSTDQMNEDGTNRNASATTYTAENSVIAAESRHIKTSKGRQTKVQGSWRQRGNTESAPVLVSQDVSSTTPNVSIGAAIHIEHDQILKLDECSTKGQPSKPEDWVVKEQYPENDEENHVDGWVIYEEPITYSKAKAPGLRELETIGKGKRNPYSGHKGGGSNHMFVHKNTEGDEASDSPPADAQQTERPISSKENRAVGDRGMTHWKPKSRPYVASDHQGNKPRGGESINRDVLMSSKMETSHDRGVKSPVQPDLHDDLPAKKHEPREESRGQRKSGPVRGDSHSLMQPAPARTMDGHDQQRFSGSRRNGNSNSHLNRVQGSHGDWGSSVQDNKQHSMPGNRNRQSLQNPHYGYHPVEPYNNDKRSDLEGKMDNVRAGPQYRERVQGHSRRGGGNFYGRQRGNGQVDDGSYQ